MQVAIFIQGFHFNFENRPKNLLQTTSRVYLKILSSLLQWETRRMSRNFWFLISEFEIAALAALISVIRQCLLAPIKSSLKTKIVHLPNYVYFKHSPQWNADQSSLLKLRDLTHTQFSPSFLAGTTLEPAMRHLHLQYSKYDVICAGFAAKWDNRYTTFAIQWRRRPGQALHATYSSF